MASSGGGRHDAQGTQRLSNEIQAELAEVRRLLNEVEQELQFAESGIDSDDTLKLAISGVGLQLSEKYNEFYNVVDKFNQGLAEIIINAFNTGKELAEKAGHIMK